MAPERRCSGIVECGCQASFELEFMPFIDMALINRLMNVPISNNQRVPAFKISTTSKMIIRHFMTVYCKKSTEHEHLPYNIYEKGGLCSLRLP
jgi:hypothetical protein